MIRIVDVCTDRDWLSILNHLYRGCLNVSNIITIYQYSTQYYYPRTFIDLVCWVSFANLLLLYDVKNANHLFFCFVQWRIFCFVFKVTMTIIDSIYWKETHISVYHFNLVTIYPIFWTLHIIQISHNIMIYTNIIAIFEISHVWGWHLVKLVHSFLSTYCYDRDVALFYYTEQKNQSIYLKHNNLFQKFNVI
jgi:hypothetical protein